MSEWQEVKLADLCIEKGVQTGPFGSQLHKKDYVAVGTPIITVEHLGDNRITKQNLPRVSDEDKERLNKYILQEGDIVFSRVGSVDRRAYVHKEEDGWLFSGRCLRVRVDRDKIDPYYLSAYFGLPSFKEYIRSIAVGATMPSLNTSLLKEVPVILPPKEKQKFISDIAYVIESKIELNKRMNETLEGMARAIFKSWFVDFDPVHTKAEGRKPEGMNAQTTALFPSTFTPDGLPDGWEKKLVGDAVDTISKTYPLKEVDEVIFLNTGDILDGKFLHTNKSDPTALPGQAKKSIQKGDILYSEIRPQNKRHAYVHFDTPDYVVSTKLMVLREKSDIPSLFIYFILTELSNIDFLQMMAESRSGTFPQITFDVLSRVDYIGPVNNEAIKVFSENVLEPLYEKMIANEKQNQTLASLRDTLLPKLISGELQVDNAAETLKEAVG